MITRSSSELYRSGGSGTALIGLRWIQPATSEPQGDGIRRAGTSQRPHRALRDHREPARGPNPPRRARGLRRRLDEASDEPREFRHDRGGEWAEGGQKDSGTGERARRASGQVSGLTRGWLGQIPGTLRHGLPPVVNGVVPSSPLAFVSVGTTNPPRDLCSCWCLLPK
jgi:hypothetical protein